MAQTTSVLMQYPEYMAMFEHDDMDADRLVAALLQIFDAQQWVTITTILNRFWKVRPSLLLF